MQDAPHASLNQQSKQQQQQQLEWSARAFFWRCCLECSGAPQYNHLCSKNDDDDGKVVISVASQTFFLLTTLWHPTGAILRPCLRIM
jgi:hypothetical protein